LEHFRGQPEYYHAAQREASGWTNCAAAKNFWIHGHFAEQKEKSKPNVRIFETTRATNNEENMNAP
jgi:hypothetical protein